MSAVKRSIDYRLGLFMKTLKQYAFSCMSIIVKQKKRMKFNN